MLTRILTLVVLTACLSAIIVKCDEAYKLSYGGNASLDCSSLKGKVEFYELPSQSKAEEFQLIKNAPENIGESEKKQQQRSVDHDKKKLTISNLAKEDVDKAYMCKNEDGANKTFNLHPQFIPDPKVKSNLSILSSSFRLVLSMQVKNAKCLWRVKRADQNNTELTIEHSAKYNISNYESKDHPNVMISDLHINKPDAQDSGVYVCSLKNEYGETYRMIDVKVKDELLALWPFLMILAQVLLCSGLFFIWEKRCAKRDSSNEYSFDQGYKQRQNPRA